MTYAPLFSVHLSIQSRSKLPSLAYEGHHRLATASLSRPVPASALGQFSATPPLLLLSSTACAFGVCWRVSHRLLCVGPLPFRRHPCLILQALLRAETGGPFLKPPLFYQTEPDASCWVFSGHTPRLYVSHNVWTCLFLPPDTRKEQKEINFLSLCHSNLVAPFLAHSSPSAHPGPVSEGMFALGINSASDIG